MRALLLGGLLLGGAAHAQAVASTCGVNRSCTTRTLAVTSTSNFTGAATFAAAINSTVPDLGIAIQLTQGASILFDEGAEATMRFDGTNLVITQDISVDGNVTATGTVQSSNLYMLTSFHGGTNPMAAGTVVGGGVQPAVAFTVTGARGRVTSGGSGGTTAVTWTVTDGVNTCTLTGPACNAGAANFRATASGNCAFAASASLTWSEATIGDCSSGPTYLNLEIEGKWQ